MYIEMFFKEFALLASGASGIQKIRELVLRLAVRGKLVPQIASHGDAESILSSIADEANVATKKRWMKYASPDAIYGIPRNWCWTAIGRMSQDWGQKVPDKPFLYIDVGGIDNQKGIISEQLELIQPEDAPSRARKLVAQGTVIYSTVRPYLRNIAIVDREFPHQAIVSTAFAIVHPLGGILPEYVFYYLRSPDFVSYVESEMIGVAYPAINDSKFFSAPIPLPPIAEQKRIVAKVDELMTLCNELEARQEEEARLNAELMASLVHSLTEAVPDGDGPVAGSARGPKTKPAFSARDIESDGAGNQSGSTNASIACASEPERHEAWRNTFDVDTKFKEAVLVGAIVKAFYEVPDQKNGEPIGNFRLQKAVYFARRHNGEHIAQMDYLKKAAGPYNPSMKYSGGIAIAKQKKWLLEARGRFGFGHMPGSATGEMDDWIARYEYAKSAQWVVKHFRFKKNEEWETLATVDYAMEHLQSVGIEPDAQQILKYIRADDEWRPKIEKLGLTEISIEAAMVEVRALFGTGGKGECQEGTA